MLVTFELDDALAAKATLLHKSWDFDDLADVLNVAVAYYCRELRQAHGDDFFDRLEGVSERDASVASDCD